MPFAPTRLKNKPGCTKRCPEGFKLDSKTCECVKDTTYLKPIQMNNPLKQKNGLSSVVKGKKGMIVKSKKKK